MTERPPSQQPHSWVPYGSPDIEEICSLCGVISTSTESDEPCSGILDDMPEPPANWEELAAGEADESPALIERLKEPVVIIAFDQNELASWRAAELPALVETVLNYKRAHGYPESVCDAYRPSLQAALGAWWDEHFTCTKTMTEVGQLPP